MSKRLNSKELLAQLNINVISEENNQRVQVEDKKQPQYETVVKFREDDTKFDFDEFLEMVQRPSFQKVVVNKFKEVKFKYNQEVFEFKVGMPAATMLRTYRYGDMTNIYVKENEKITGNIKKVELKFSSDSEDLNKIKSWLNECKLLTTNSKPEQTAKSLYEDGKSFFGPCNDSQKNTTGSIVYKGDHLWVLYGNKKGRYREVFIFLMTENDDKKIALTFLYCCLDDGIHGPYCTALTEIINRYASIHAKERWEYFFE